MRINGEKGTVYVSKRQTVCGSYDSNVIEFRSPSLRKKENHTKVIDIATYNLQSECEKKLILTAFDWYHQYFLLVS